MKPKINLKNLLTGYVYVNPNITTKNFPVPEKIETEGYRIIRPGKSFTSQEALDMMKKEGLRPGNIYELALLKQNHPEEFKPWEWVLAFGQTWKDAGGRHRVPGVIASSDGGFFFLLGHFEGVWRESNALLGFCDSDSPKKASTLEKNSLPLRDLENKIDTLIEALQKAKRELK